MLTAITLKVIKPTQEWVGDAQNYEFHALVKLIGWSAALKEVAEHRDNEWMHKLQESKLTSSFQKFCQQRMLVRIELDEVQEYIIDPWGQVKQGDEVMPFNATTLKTVCQKLSLKITTADLLPVVTK